jgi:hypothetical protein|nr:MAG TPA: hypothetical protein [Caudoviricetes sp.]
MKLFLQTIGCTIVVFAVLIIVALIYGSATSTQGVSVQRVNQAKSNQVETSVSETESEGMVIADNDYFKATYQGISESFGFYYMNLKFENKTDGEITIVPMESSVDDTMVMFATGVPSTMQAHKSYNAAIMIGSNEPKNNIEFKLSAMDVNWSELFTTDTIRID